jgi:hypothetical protein
MMIVLPEADFSTIVLMIRMMNYYHMQNWNVDTKAS